MILVVDDDKTIRLSLKLILERNGYEVTLAEGPKEAIQIITNTNIADTVSINMSMVDTNVDTMNTIMNTTSTA